MRHSYESRTTRTIILLLLPFALLGCSGSSDAPVKPDPLPEVSAFDATPVSNLAVAVSAHVAEARSDLGKTPPDTENAGKHLQAAAAGLPPANDAARNAARKTIATQASLEARIESLSGQLAQAMDTLNAETQKRKNAEKAVELLKKQRDAEAVRARLAEKERRDGDSRNAARARAGWVALALAAAGAGLGYALKSLRPVVWFGTSAVGIASVPWIRDSILASKAWGYLVDGTAVVALIALVGAVVIAYKHRSALLKLISGATLTATEDKIVAKIGGTPSKPATPAA